MCEIFTLHSRVMHWRDEVFISCTSHHDDMTHHDVSCSKFVKWKSKLSYVSEWMKANGTRKMINIASWSWILHESSSLSCCTLRRNELRSLTLHFLWSWGKFSLFILSRFMLYDYLSLDYIEGAWFMHLYRNLWKSRIEKIVNYSTWNCWFSIDEIWKREI